MVMGKRPVEPAMSIWLYFTGSELPVPCLSNPDANNRKATGPKSKNKFKSVKST